MKKKTRRVLGVLGMIVAILGGIAWFTNQYIPAAFLWGGAALIVIKLNKNIRQK
jgi:hypothetical protein